MSIVGHIDHIRLGILSEEEILELSVCEVTNHKLPTSENPIGEPNTLFDPRSGSYNKKQGKCPTCSKNDSPVIFPDCPGHFMHIALEHYVIHPFAFQNVIMLLTLQCRKCKDCVLNQELISLKSEKLKSKKGLDKVTALYKECLKLQKCSNCKASQPTYITKDKSIYETVKKTVGRSAVKSEHKDSKLSNKEIYSRFRDYTPKMLHLIGLIPKMSTEELKTYKSYNHPKNYIMTTLVVPPPTVCLPVEMDGGIAFDTITGKLVDITKCNEKLKENLREDVRSATIDKLEQHIHTLFDNSKGISKQFNGRPTVGYLERLKGKKGLFRNNMQGKRVDFTARTVIGPDPCVDYNTVVIPESIARKLTKPERVTERNIDEIVKLINMGKVTGMFENGDTYGNCRRLDALLQETGFKLQEGDIVERLVLKNIPKKRIMGISADIDDKLVSNIVAVYLDTDYVTNEKLTPKQRDYIKKIFNDPTSFKREEINPYRAMMIKNKFDNAVTTGISNFKLYKSDIVKRNGQVMDVKVYKRKMVDPITKSFSFTSKDENGQTVNNKITIKPGDIIERHMMDEVAWLKLDPNTKRKTDEILINRQPSLHPGSIMSPKIKILPWSTMRLSLESMGPYNADCDGDEMNIHVNQSLDVHAEQQQLLAYTKNMTTPQASRAIFSMKLDTLTAAYMMTVKKIVIPNFMFMDITYNYADKFGDIENFYPKGIIDKSIDILDKKMEYICKIHQEFKVYSNPCKCNTVKTEYFNGNIYCLGCDKTLYSVYTGYGLLSLVLPYNFEYTGGKWKLKIVRGVIVEGAFCKKTLGNVHNSILQILSKYYLEEETEAFISNFRSYTNYWMLHNGFSVGISDCVPTKKIQEDIKENIVKCYTEAYSIMQTEKDPIMRELKVGVVLNNAQTMGDNIMKKSINEKNNRLLTMINAESKGNNINVSQIQGCVSQQMISGERIPLNWGKRSSPHDVKCQMINPFMTGDRESFTSVKECNLDGITTFFRNPDKIKKTLAKKISDITLSASEHPNPCIVNNKEYETIVYKTLSNKQHNEATRWNVVKNEREFANNKFHHLDKLFQSRGYVRASYYEGLNPKEFWAHAAGARTGIISTAVETQETGYSSRQMVKCMEEFKIDYNGTTNNSKGLAVSFMTGMNNLDPRHEVMIEGKLQFCNVKQITNMLNNEKEFGDL